MREMIQSCIAAMRAAAIQPPGRVRVPTAAMRASVGPEVDGVPVVVDPEVPPGSFVVDGLDSYEVRDPRPGGDRGDREAYPVSGTACTSCM